MKQWYELFFEKYANRYDDEEFTKGTLGECDFIEKELGFDRNKRILDIGCGTGRHSIELAKRGYTVTGMDLSAQMLERAGEKARKEGVKMKFIKMDARELSFEDEFDMVIMLCEGAFPLMETDEMNYRILRNAEKALKNNGKLIFTTLNALFPLFHSVKDFLDSKRSEGDVVTENISFDLMTFREYGTISFQDERGEKNDIQTNERYYTPSEITWLLKSLKFKGIHIHGARLGKFSRAHELTTDDFEMLVIAEK